MSCLFHSISYFIKLSNIEIRNKICNYLENNEPLIENIDTKLLLELEEEKNYITSMRNTSTMGGAIEIQSACNIWNLKIIVKNIRNNSNTSIEFIPLHKKIDLIINISWDGGHYEPIRE
tara:strand:- start:764 stop:1120 length:357 start_codon:yes stop_codon:yes gene_type:complete